MKNENRKENRSIYLYTALIFAVALVLILLTAFSQPRVNKLGNRAQEFTPAATESTTSDELAKYANMATALDAANKELNSKIADNEKALEVYDKLLAANAQAANGGLKEAADILSQVDEETLTENQKILFDELNIKINKGKEQ